MKLHTEDPRLTAFLLGELPESEAKAVEQAVAEDAALQDALRELRTIQRVLTETLPTAPTALHQSQRENILRAAAEAAGRDHSTRISRMPRARIFVPLAAAAALGLAFLFLHYQPETPHQPAVSNDGTPVGGKESPGLQSPSVRLMPAPGPQDRGKQASNTSSGAGLPDSALPVLRARDYIAAAEFPTLELPVQSGKSSLEWIRQSVITKRELPDHNAVRLEEMLNSFSLRPAGLTVVAKMPAKSWHPDNRDDGAISHAATISTETMACPWKPSANLVIISIRDSSNTDCDIKAVFHADSANVRRYRLLGFSSVVGQDSQPLPTRLPARSSATLAIEIEPSTPAGDLGSVEWSVNDQPAAPVTLQRHGDAEPSDDARFAALVCTYALWLVREPGGLIDTDLLAALARETASGSLSADRSDFLNLIDLSLNL